MLLTPGVFCPVSLGSALRIDDSILLSLLSFHEVCGRGV